MNIIVYWVVVSAAAWHAVVASFTGSSVEKVMIKMDITFKGYNIQGYNRDGYDEDG